jgi:hypothetical protein
MKLSWGAALTAAVAVFVLSGCSSVAPSPSLTDFAGSTPAVSPSPVSLANSPLRCSDLVTSADADTALASPSAPSDFSKLLSYPVPADFASTMAGGIRCAWVADGSKAIGQPGAPWLDVQILPGAATAWTSYTFGDGPGTTATTAFAGFNGAHSCGDPGCKATTPIGSAWVSIMLHSPGSTTGDPLAETSEGEVFAQLAPAAAALFATVQKATTAQLDWPATLARTPNPEIEPCSSFLKAPALAHALGVPSIGDYASDAPLPNDIVSLETTALRHAGIVHCTAGIDGSARADFVLLTNNAAIVDRIATGLASESALHAGQLPNQTGTETTVSNCSSDRTACDLWFTLGRDAIYVSSASSDSMAIATAIIDQAR